MIILKPFSCLQNTHPIRNGKWWLKQSRQEAQQKKYWKVKQRQKQRSGTTKILKRGQKRRSRTTKILKRGQKIDKNVLQQQNEGKVCGITFFYLILYFASPCLVEFWVPSPWRDSFLSITTSLIFSSQMGRDRFFNLFSQMGRGLGHPWLRLLWSGRHIPGDGDASWRWMSPIHQVNLVVMRLMTPVMLTVMIASFLVMVRHLDEGDIDWISILVNVEIVVYQHFSSDDWWVDDIETTNE